MKRKVYAIGFLASALFMVALTPACYTRLQSFQQYFHHLDPAASSLNPVERVVFSLVLANSDSNPAKK